MQCGGFRVQTKVNATSLKNRLNSARYHMRLTYTFKLTTYSKLNKVTWQNSTYLSEQHYVGRSVTACVFVYGVRVASYNNKVKSIIQIINDDQKELTGRPLNDDGHNRIQSIDFK